MWYHVRLPSLHVDAAVDAPPEVVLWLTLPRKHTESWRDTGSMKHSEQSKHHVTQAGQQSKKVSWQEQRSLTSLGQGSCHLVLGGVDVARRPPALSPQSWQSLHKHLRGETQEGFTYSHSWGYCVPLGPGHSQLFGQWCVCSPPLWHQRGVSPPEPASSKPSGLAFLKGNAQKWRREEISIFNLATIIQRFVHLEELQVFGIECVACRVQLRLCAGAAGTECQNYSEDLDCFFVCFLR